MPIILLVLLQGCTNPEELSNKKMVAIAQSYAIATKTENQEEKLEILKTVKKDIEELIERYPETSVAVRLTSGDNIGVVGYNSIEEQINSTEFHIELNQCKLHTTYRCFLRELNGYVNKGEVLHDSRLQDIALGQLKIGDLDGALSTIERIDHKYERFYMMLVLHAYSGHMTEAVSGLDNPPSPVGVVEKTLFDLKVKHGKERFVRNIVDISNLDQAIQLANGIKDSGLKNKLEVYKSLLNGDLEPIKEHLIDLDKKDQELFFGSIVNMLVMSGQLDLAVSLSKQNLGYMGDHPYILIALFKCKRDGYQSAAPYLQTISKDSQAELDLVLLSLSGKRHQAQAIIEAESDEEIRSRYEYTMMLFSGDLTGYYEKARSIDDGKLQKDTLLRSVNEIYFAHKLGVHPR